MAFDRIRKIDTGSIAAGGTFDFVQSEEVDLVLRKVVIVEATNASIYSVLLTLNVAEQPLLRPDACAAIFLPSNPQVPEFDVDVPKGTKVNGRVTNNESAARRLFIHLFYEKK